MMKKFYASIYSFQAVASGNRSLDRLSTLLSWDSHLHPGLDLKLFCPRLVNPKQPRKQPPENCLVNQA